MNFKNYLQNKRLSNSTVTAYSQRLKSFKEWKEKENLQLNGLNYNDLLRYIAYLRQKKYSNRYINQLLGIVRYYLDYKLSIGEIKTNPAQNLSVKGVVRKLPGNLLDEKELDNIYRNYQPKHESYKIILGLLVYQGLTLGELQKLKAENLKLTEGKIYVPGSRKSNGRWLKLKAFQILMLHDYINQIEQKDGQLFISPRGSKELDNTATEIFREAKKINPKATNAKQIRASVITNKLKTTGLRETQYFAGHRYVSSTERYKLGNIENLKKQIEKHHPLGNEALA